MAEGNAITRNCFNVHMCISMCVHMFITQTHSIYKNSATATGQEMKLATLSSSLNVSQVIDYSEF